MKILAAVFLLVCGSVGATDIKIRDFDTGIEMRFFDCHVWRFDAAEFHSSCETRADFFIADPWAIPHTPIARTVVFDGFAFIERLNCYLVTAPDAIVVECPSAPIFAGGFE